MPVAHLTSTCTYYHSLAREVMAVCRTNDITLQLVLQFLRESEYGTSFDALQNERFDFVLTPHVPSKRRVTAESLSTTRKS